MAVKHSLPFWGLLIIWSRYYIRIIKCIIYSLRAVHNCHYHSFGGGGQWKKNFDTIHFQHFNPFFIIFMANYPFERCWCVHFLREGKWVWESACFVHSIKCWQLWTALIDNQSILNLNKITLKPISPPPQYTQVSPLLCTSLWDHYNYIGGGGG